MQRRAFLGGLAGVGGGALAGCAAPAGQQTLSNPAETREADEVVLHFGGQGDPVARSTIQSWGTPLTGRILPMRYYMWHRDGTTVESVTLSIRSPPAGHEVPASVFLAVPQNGEIPDITLESDPDTGTPVIDIEDLGIMGGGTFGLEFYIEPTVRTDPLPVRIDIQSRVTGDGFFGRDYRLEGTTKVEIERGDSGQ